MGVGLAVHWLEKLAGDRKLVDDWLENTFYMGIGAFLLYAVHELGEEYEELCYEDRERNYLPARPQGRVQYVTASISYDQEDDPDEPDWEIFNEPPGKL